MKGWDGQKPDGSFQDVNMKSVTDKFGSKVKQVNNNVIVELGSGNYRFSYPLN